MSEIRPSHRFTCGGCDNTWPGTTMCHCSGCHATFSGIGLFDKHRSMSKGCSDPADWGDAVRLVDGIWRGPEWDKAAAAFGRTA